MGTQSIKHTDEEFIKLAQDHNVLYAAYTQRGEELKGLEDQLIQRQDSVTEFLEGLGSLLAKLKITVEVK